MKVQEVLENYNSLNAWEIFPRQISRELVKKYFPGNNFNYF